MEEGLEKEKGNKEGYLFLSMYSFLQLFGQLLGLEIGRAGSGRCGFGDQAARKPVRLDLGALWLYVI